MVKVTRHIGIGTPEIAMKEVENFFDCEEFIDETKQIAELMLSNGTPVDFYVAVHYNCNGYGENCILWSSLDTKNFTCPSCKYESTNVYGRTCPDCDYNGDWIHPGYWDTYSDRKLKIENYLNR